MQNGKDYTRPRMYALRVLRKKTRIGTMCVTSFIKYGSVEMIFRTQLGD